MDKTENIENRNPNHRSLSRDDDDHTTLPLTTGDDDTTLWLVSFDDNDDRELRAPQIAEALLRGEIDRETIVWREGLTDWLPLANVPSLARLLPASGATANAPLVVPTPSGQAPTAKLPEAKAAAPAESMERPAEPTKHDDSADAPRPGERPAIKGTTKIGLPRVDPTKPLPKAPERAPLFAKAGSKAPDQTPLPKAAPKLGSADQTPLPGKFSPKPAEQTPLPGKTLPKAPDRTPLPGKTLPKAPDRTPLPGRPPPPGARSAEATKGVVTSVASHTPVAPRVSGGTPKTSTAETAKAETGKTSSAESPVSARAKMNSNPDIWGAPGDDEEEAPISIEPESMRPPTPTDTRAINRAKALSPGILAVRKPKAPPTRAQPERPVANEPEESAPDSAGTPSLNALAHLPPTTNPVDEEILRLVGGDLGPPILSGPTIEVPDVTPSAAETPLLAAPFDLGALTREAPSDDIPIEVSSSEATTKTAVAEVKASKPATASAPVSKATPAPESKPSKRATWPILVGGAVVAAIAVYSMREHPAPEQPAEPRATGQTENPTAPTATPETAAPAQEPAAQAPTATAEPAQAASTPQTVAATTPSHAKSSDGNKELPAAKTMDTGNTPARKTDTPSAAAAPVKEAKAEPPPPPQKEVDVDAEFDKTAASAVLGAAAQQASSCRKEGDPTGVATVHVTFSNAGRATRAVVEGPPFAGTATGGCIADILRKTKVPPYGGDRVTVTKRVVIQ